MNRLFKNKRKKPPESFPAILVNIAAGPVIYQARSNIGPEDGQTRSNQGPQPLVDQPDITLALEDRTSGGSQIVFRDKVDEEGEFHASVASTSGVVVGGTERRNSRTSECF